MKKKFLLLTIAVTIVSLVSSCEKVDVKEISLTQEYQMNEEGGGEDDGMLPPTNPTNSTNSIQNTDPTGNTGE